MNHANSEDICSRLSWAVRAGCFVLATVHIASAGGPPDFAATRHVKTKVEIAPKEFLDLERWDWLVDDPKNKVIDEFTRIKLKFAGSEIVWEGEEIPIILRKHENTLYLACYRRPTNSEVVEKTQYFRLDEGRFVPIPWSTFPPAIATQNMWVSDFRLSSILALDTDDGNFQSSAGAAVWYELMNGGKPLPAKTSFVDKEILDEFKAKYQPAPLSSIMPPTTQPKGP